MNPRSSSFLPRPPPRDLARALFLVLLPLCLLLAARATPTPKTSDNKPVQLTPLQVKARPFSSFGIALGFLVDPKQKMIRRMFIIEVVEHSEAASKGLQPGCEIISADDIPVSSLEHRIDPTSTIHRLFINRKRFDRIKLEVIPAPAEKPRTVFLTEGRDPNRPIYLQWLFP